MKTLATKQKDSNTDIINSDRDQTSSLIINQKSYRPMKSMVKTQSIRPNRVEIKHKVRKKIVLM